MAELLRVPFAVASWSLKPLSGSARRAGGRGVGREAGLEEQLFAENDLVGRQRVVGRDRSLVAVGGSPDWSADLGSASGPGRGASAAILAENVAVRSAAQQKVASSRRMALPIWRVAAPIFRTHATLSTAGRSGPNSS